MEHTNACRIHWVSEWNLSAPPRTSEWRFEDFAAVQLGRPWPIFVHISRKQKIWPLYTGLKEAVSLKFISAPYRPSHDRSI